jgi:hypothetical protein
VDAAVAHRACAAILFRNDVAPLPGAFDGLLELRAALAAGLRAEDDADAFGADSIELAIQAMVGVADPAVSNFFYR